MNPTLRVIRRATGAPALMVLPPGACMTAQDFATAGFFAAVDERRLALDFVAVDLDLEAISSGAALPALATQILEPARQQGYATIWLGGISLGGLVALCCVADNPRSVDGLCLLAPYPGSHLTSMAIEGAGGLEHWAPDQAQLSDPEFRAWHWLKQTPAGFPAFVGYGSEDRFAPGIKRIAERFPASARRAVPGGHDWPVWRALWENFLDNAFLAA